jgi:hypothetical protein
MTFTSSSSHQRSWSVHALKAVETRRGFAEVLFLHNVHVVVVKLFAGFSGTLVVVDYGGRVREIVLNVGYEIAVVVIVVR